MGKARGHRVRGQAAVESALALPLAVLVALGILQLACVEQARLLLGAAVFHAARAGAVWSGDPERMRDAARFAILPGIEAPVDVSGLGRAWLHAESLDAELASAGVEGGLLRVDVLAPVAADFVGAAGVEVSELPFDDPVGPEGPLALRVRVRWRYELRIPFAQAVIFAASMLAHDADDPLEVAALARLAREQRRYFLPLTATYRVRMQSPFHRRNLSSGGAR